MARVIAHRVLHGYLMVFKLRGNGTLSIRMFDEGFHHQRVCDGSDAPNDSDNYFSGDFSDADEATASPQLLGKGLAYGARVASPGHSLARASPFL